MGVPSQGTDDKNKNRVMRRWLVVRVGLALLGAMLLYGLAYLAHRWFGF
jgi:hypothetical protein